MDQRIRKLKAHFWPIPNALSLLEDYHNNNGESILTLDLSIRKLIGSDGNDVTDAVNKYLTKEAPDTPPHNYNLLNMDIEFYNLQQISGAIEDRENELECNDWDYLSLIFKLYVNLLTNINHNNNDMNVMIEIPAFIKKKQFNHLLCNEKEPNVNNNWYYYLSHILKVLTNVDDNIMIIIMI